MRTTTSTLLALGALALLSAGCELELCLPNASPLAQTAAPIVGGTVDTQNRATVALLLTNGNGSRGICSGSVVAVEGSKGYVLTAAHCVQGTVDKVFDATDWIDCTSQGDASKCNAEYTPSGWKAHPSYDPETLANDYAIVVFDGASASTPIVPVDDGPDALVTGTTIEISGFGRTYSGADDPSKFQTKRHRTDALISSLSDRWIRIDGSTGKTACFGDSGGPAYAEVDGVRRVVGVASNADGQCAQVSNYSRVSDAYASFIAPNLPTPCDDCGAGGGSQGSGGSGSTGAGAGSGSGSGSGSGAGSGSTGAGAGSGSGSGSGGDSSGAGAGLGSGGDDGFDADGMPCTPTIVRCSTGAAGGDRGLPAAVLAVIAARLLRRRSRTS